MNTRHKWLWGAAAALLAGGLLGVVACRRGVLPPTDPDAGKRAEPDGPPLFRDVTAETGISNVYHNGQDAGHYAIPESLGGGVALIDFDGDGLLDIFVTGGGYYTGPDKKEMKGYPSKLYKNLGGWKFKDVTKDVGLDGPLFYTHGAAVGDYDRDGWPDLLVTGYGRLVLYHNEPVDPGDPKKGRKFVDVTEKAGLKRDHFWSTSVSFADLDGDGYPDLYICQYVNWGLQPPLIHPMCGGYTSDVKQDVCPPKQFDAQPHALYRNNGNGTFTDVSKEAGLRMPRTKEELDAYADGLFNALKAERAKWTAGELDKLKEQCKSARDRLEKADKEKDYGKGLGVIAVDVNGDRKPDVYVANDTTDNFLYMNHSKPGKIMLEEVGMEVGVARDDNGVANGSMGLAAGDYEGNGRASIWVTNYENEKHALYTPRSTGARQYFLFSTQMTGIGVIGQLFVGFGTDFVDVDNDGWLDLIVSNGHVIRHPARAGLQQRPVILRNTDHPTQKAMRWFKEITPQGGDYFRTGHIGRGLAAGDLDNDGRTDLVITHLNEPAVVLRNEAEPRHWLGLELAGKGHADVTGARIILEAAGRKQTRFAKGGGSYLTAPDKRHLFGLGAADKVDRVTVEWPSGENQQWDGKELPVDHYWRLAEEEKAVQKPHSREAAATPAK
jgi:hypothetical protein